MDQLFISCLLYFLDCWGLQ